jgi:pimeloyl-ACP methyl ester carboxylesterase
MNRNAKGREGDSVYSEPLRVRGWICFAFLALLTGCATTVIAPQRPDTVIVLPGIGGGGDVYDQVVRSLYDHGSDDCLRVFSWGYSWPLFWFTNSSGTLHNFTEQQLADQIVEWRSNHPHSHIVLIAHSAGAGVVVGALSRLSGSMEVGPVILLAPSLAPDFDLRPALKHTDIIHVFYNPDDDFWQGLGPTVFGTYDGAHRDGAGRTGFSLASLSPQQRVRVIQHPYESQWNELGNHGGHFDWMAEPFVAVVLKPLIDQPLREGNTILAGIARSSAANQH